MLAGYISANRVDLAGVNKTGEGIRLFDEERFVSTHYNTLHSVLALYLKRHNVEIANICLGVAGPVIGDEVSPTNLPWVISGNRLKEEFEFEQVTLINDIVATAHGIGHLKADKFFDLNDTPSDGWGNIALIAAGSGLGEALIYRDGRGFQPYASEGGHGYFAPGNQIESELWEYIYADQGYVEVEDVVSWKGLETIYSFLCEMHGYRRSEWFDSAEYRAASVIEQGLSGRDAAATATLDLFIDCYAAETADLALKGMTLGGVYVGGQIAPRIITALDQGRFMRRFVQKGKMESLLASMPVRVIIEDRTALIGAAAVARRALEVA
jgi:glucokinase